MARNLLTLILVMILAKVMANASSGSRWWPIENTLEMERDLRVIQAILLVALLSVFTYYRVSLGRNLRGLILGYGVLLGTAVVDLAFNSWLGGPYDQWWFHLWWGHYIRPIAYLPVLLIWSTALWSYEPMPLPSRETQVHQDYQQLAASTKRRLAEARSYVRRAVGS